MSGAASRPVWATSFSITAHAAALAALIWFGASRPPVIQAMPQIELLPPLPVTPAPQDALPSPIDLPVASQPTPPAAFSPPVPLPDPPQVIAGASNDDIQPAPRKPAPRPKSKLPPQPVRTQEMVKTDTPATAAPVNGNEAKETTVIAEAPAKPQPAGLPPDYIGLIRARLQQVKQYPVDARVRRQEGIVTMDVVLDSSGRVLGAHMEKSSGVQSLDDEAAAMVQRGSPFPPFPKSITETTLDLAVPIDFSLK